jgi:hypothetical protein
LGRLYIGFKKNPLGHALNKCRLVCLQGIRLAYGAHHSFVSLPFIVLDAPSL